MKKLLSIGWIFAATVIAGLAIAPAAQAGTIVTATWTGTIRVGNDAGNHFGGALNSGDAFTLKSVFDTAQGTYSPVGRGSINGGGMATMTVNGHAFTFDLDPSSYQFDAFGSLRLFLGDTSQTFLSAGFFAPGLPGSILTSFDKDCLSFGSCSGSFEIAGPGAFSGGSFDATHLNVSVATTPVPAALPLFVSSLLGLGLVMRRKVGSPV